METHEWKKSGLGPESDVRISCAEDLAHLAELDRKRWCVTSMPVDGVRFDRRTLELMDTDHDGRIRCPEVLAAVEFLKQRGVDLALPFTPPEDLTQRLADVHARQADLAAAEPTDAEKQAMRDWEAAGAKDDVAVLGDATAAADAALASVETALDGFFEPPADLPLVTDEPDRPLPLRERLNPRFADAIAAFADRCVTPLLGARDTLARRDWNALKAKFAPYRAWLAAKPVMCADAKAKLDDEEREILYTRDLASFLRNFVSMADLYSRASDAIFQTGTLRLDAKELDLCFHVADEAAHAALAEKSGAYLVYAKLRRPSEKAERLVCAVLTAGSAGGIYVGRNGTFLDRDGRDWDATVVRIVENPVSLREAIWTPWRKIGEAFGALVRKFMGNSQAKAVQSVSNSLATKTKLAPEEKTEAPSANAGNGALIASSVAALGVGIGMLGAAVASLAAVFSKMPWYYLLVAVAVVFLAVSLPSVALAWLKLRCRDLGAILNASGWAVNRRLRFSMRQARTFTRVR